MIGCLKHQRLCVYSVNFHRTLSAFFYIRVELGLNVTNQG